MTGQIVNIKWTNTEHEKEANHSCPEAILDELAALLGVVGGTPINL